MQTKTQARCDECLWKAQGGGCLTARCEYEPLVPQKDLMLVRAIERRAFVHLFRANRARLN